MSPDESMLYGILSYDNKKILVNGSEIPAMEFNLEENENEPREIDFIDTRDCLNFDLSPDKKILVLVLGMSSAFKVIDMVN